MWLSKQVAARMPALDEGAAATVSVGGEHPAVVTDGERRQARLFSPGGYCWRPGSGDTVLVVGGGEPCVGGCEQTCPVKLAAGEVYVYSNGASIYLKNDGDVLISGRLRLEGALEITGGATIDGGLIVDGAAVAGGI